MIGVVVPAGYHMMWSPWQILATVMGVLGMIALGICLIIYAAYCYEQGSPWERRRKLQIERERQRQQHELDVTKVQAQAAKELEEMRSKWLTQ